MDWGPLLLSLELSLWTTVVLLAVGLPAAWWLVFRRRWWTPLVEAVIALPVVLPPTVLGFLVLAMIAPQTVVGRFWLSLTGEPLAFSFGGLLVASVLYSLPFVVKPIAAGFAAVDRRVLEASATLGASEIATAARVLVPMSWPAVVTGTVLGFAHTVGEFGVVLMVGGNLPGRTRTVSIAIYDHVQRFDMESATRTSLLLLGFSFAVLAITYALHRRTPASWPTR